MSYRVHSVISIFINHLFRKFLHIIFPEKFRGVFKMRIQIPLVFLGMLIGFSCTRIDALHEGEVRKVTFLKSKQPISQPDVIRLQSGDLMMVFRGSQSKSSSQGKILLSRSKNQGKTWSAQDTIIQTTLELVPIGMKVKV